MIQSEVCQVTYFYRSFIIVEPLLNERGQLSDSTALLSQDALCTGRQNYDLCFRGCHAHFNTTVAIYGELLL